MELYKVQRNILFNMGMLIILLVCLILNILGYKNLFSFLIDILFFLNIIIVVLKNKKIRVIKQPVFFNSENRIFIIQNNIYIIFTLITSLAILACVLFMDNNLFIYNFLFLFFILINLCEIIEFVVEKVVINEKLILKLINNKNNHFFKVYNLKLYSFSNEIFNLEINNIKSTAKFSSKYNNYDELMMKIKSNVSRET